MFIAPLSTIAKRWKQPKCPSRDKWINKMWFIYTMEYSSTLKRKVGFPCGSLVAPDCRLTERRWVVGQGHRLLVTIGVAGSRYQRLEKTIESSLTNLWALRVRLSNV